MNDDYFKCVMMIVGVLVTCSLWNIELTLKGIRDKLK